MAANVVKRVDASCYDSVHPNDPQEAMWIKSGSIHSIFKGGASVRVCWEETGILVPVFRLAGQGLSDGEIAIRLNTSEVNVRRCGAWIMHFLQFSDRIELMPYAAVRAEM